MCFSGISTQRESTRNGSESALEERPRSDYWDRATDGEVQLIKGDLEAAARLYQEAVDSAPEEVASHASTWRQARRLLQHLNASLDQSNAIERVFTHLR